MGLTFTQNLNGVAVGVAQARELPGELPFLYEYGVDLLAAFGDNSTLVSAVVPVNLMYRFDFGQIRLLPFAGLNLTAHIIGQDKYDGVTSNWFKKDEDGDVACHRIQLGAQFGAKVLYEKYFIGISYQPSLTRFADNTNLNVLNVSVGLTFSPLKYEHDQASNSILGGCHSGRRPLLLRQGKYRRVIKCPHRDLGTRQVDYTFCGKDVGSDVISKNNLKWIFREDGICENLDKEAQDDDEIPIPYFQYKYSAKNKTLSLILGIFVIDCDIIKLNSSDLVLSAPSIQTFLFYGTYKKGKEVDTYKGVTIYEYYDSHDGESYWDGKTYCYNDSKGNIVRCDKLSDEEFDGTFTGDKNGYYNTVINYFKRVK